MASEKQSVYFQPRKVNKKSLFRSPWLGSPETSGIQTAVRTAKGVDDASSGKRMMEETDNGRGLVTLHRRQEGGRQTRVGAGREKRVIPASWNHPPAVCCRCCSVASSVRCCCGVDKEEPEESAGSWTWTIPLAWARPQKAGAGGGFTSLSP